MGSQQVILFWLGRTWLDLLLNEGQGWRGIRLTGIRTGRQATGQNTWSWPRVQSLVLKANSAESLNRVWLFATPRTAACQASLSIINSQSLLKLMSIESVMPSNHLILCHPLLLPSIFLSIRVFSNESVLCIRWPNYWSFSASASVLPMNIQDLTSFRTDWLDLLAVQGTLQHHSSKTSFLQCSAFFTVQLSIHDY